MLRGMMALLAGAGSALADVALADDKAAHSSAQQNIVHGAPAKPSRAWTLAAGGRIYDTWWDALDRPKPTATNPSYPATGKRTGATTWRCVECHGWDYKGSDGLYRSGERFTGIKGIRAARQMSTERVAALMRAAPHNYTPDMIRDDELARLAAFVVGGQHDTDKYIDRESGKVDGDAARGAGIYQTVCAVCHGFDGRLLDWGKPGEPGYVGTEASALPWEVLHKIRNAHPGAAMVNLRAFPLQDAIDVLAYAQTLPTK